MGKVLGPCPGKFIFVLKKYFCTGEIFLYWEKYFCTGKNIFVLPLWATVLVSLSNQALVVLHNYHSLHFKKCGMEIGTKLQVLM